MSHKKLLKNCTRKRKRPENNKTVSLKTLLRVFLFHWTVLAHQKGSLVNERGTNTLKVFIAQDIVGRYPFHTRRDFNSFGMNANLSGFILSRKIHPLLSIET